MKECICGNRALYFNRLHRTAVCKIHKTLHEEGKLREHIYEKLGQKLTAQRLAKIVESLSSAIKIADRCADQILEESMRIVETITNSCMRALGVVKQKQRYYAGLLRICHKRIFDDQIKEFERIGRTSLVVKIPHQLHQIESLYASDFLKEFEMVNQISTMPVNDAKHLLEEGYGLFLEGHPLFISSIAISSDNKYIASGGMDKTVRIWNLQDKTQEAVLRGHNEEVSSVAITSDNKYIVSGGKDRTVRIWNLRDRTQEAVLKGHSNSIISLAITSNSKYIVSGGLDKTVRIWNIQKACARSSFTNR